MRGVKQAIPTVNTPVLYLYFTPFCRCWCLVVQTFNAQPKKKSKQKIKTKQILNMGIHITMTRGYYAQVDDADNLDVDALLAEVDAMGV